MYTMMESTPTRIQNGDPLSRVTILVDTADDIPEPHDGWDAGSMCMIADTHTYKILTNEREWA